MVRFRMCVHVAALVTEDGGEQPRSAGEAAAEHTEPFSRKPSSCGLIGKPCTWSSNGHQSSAVGRQGEDKRVDTQEGEEARRRGGEEERSGWEGDDRERNGSGEDVTD